MKSFLVSALKPLVVNGRGALTSRHDGAWLVWEPGSWKAPRAQTLVLDAVKDYRSVSKGTLKGAEALAIALPAQERVTVGRAPDADVSINDGTLSSMHLVLLRGADGAWHADELGSTNGTTVDGAELKAGGPVPLQNGAAIKAGQVALTFHTAEGLWTRLSA
ncbi:MAG: FHA domain-containing protein [Myxococcaceae bacterium]|nr:FHA domain-containing protein [Myxococcaceae bacterium]